MRIFVQCELSVLSIRNSSALKLLDRMFKMNDVLFIFAHLNDNWLRSFTKDCIIFRRLRIKMVSAESNDRRKTNKVKR